MLWNRGFFALLIICFNTLLLLSTNIFQLSLFDAIRNHYNSTSIRLLMPSMAFSSDETASDNGFSTFKKLKHKARRKRRHPRSSYFERLFAERRKMVDEACLKHFGINTTRDQWETWPNTAEFLRHSVYNDEMEVLVCLIAKSATRSITKRIDGIWFKNRTDPSKPIDQETIDQRQNYAKILFVRDPVDRLFSTWYDKFFMAFAVNDQYMSDWREYVLKHYSKNYNNTDPWVAYDEFFEFLDKEGMQTMTNVHWMRYVDICNPCHVGYDFIGHFENLEEEMAYIMQTVAPWDNRTIPEPRPESFAATKTMALPVGNAANLTLRDVYLPLLSASLGNRVFNKYQVDFDLFGYTMPVL